MSVAPEVISEWKQKYPFVFKTIINSKEIYFRSLSREDYIGISAKQIQNPDLDYELETVKTCLLNGLDEAELKGKSGIVTVLSEQIMIKSGFQAIEVEEV